MVASDYSGIQFPRFTTAGRSAITTPPTGMFVFNTDTNYLEHFDGALWQSHLISPATASAVNFGQVTTTVTGQAVALTVTGTDTNIGINISPKGTGAVQVQNTTSLAGLQGAEALRALVVGSAVNRLEVSGSVTTSPVLLTANGTDTNIGLTYTTKGTGSHLFVAGGGTQFQVTNTATAVNALQASGSATGVALTLTAVGTDTNIAINLASKGTGLATLGTTGTASATAGAATLSTQRGTITSEAITTAAGADYVLTLTNTKVTTASIVMATADNGTNTTEGLAINRVTPGSGSVLIHVRNTNATTALNGTIKINFVLHG